MSQKKEHAKVLIVGSGPAGYTAAIYAARAMLNPILVSGMEPGGQLTTTTDVENFPGFSSVIQGPWLMEEMRKQAEAVGTIFQNDVIKQVNFSNKPFELIGESDTIYTADSVIISTGAQARWLNLDSETKFRGFGVSACATCDGFFYKGQDVVVVGAGDTAAEEATYLSNICKKVTLLVRKDYMRASKAMQHRVDKTANIEVLYNTEIDEVIGTNVVDGVRAVNNQTGEKIVIPVTGVFIAIGHTPNTGIFKGILDMDETGYLITKGKSAKTNLPGVFAAGDVQDKEYRQAVTAAGTGCMAALDAERYLGALV